MNCVCPAQCQLLCNYVPSNLTLQIFCPVKKIVDELTDLLLFQFVLSQSALNYQALSKHNLLGLIFSNVPKFDLRNILLRSIKLSDT